MNSIHAVPATVKVNGRTHTVDVVPGTPLLDVLRDELHLLGTKDGCREGECGACTVLVDGRPLDSCLTAVHTMGDVSVTTIEGVSVPGRLSELQQALVDAGGVQCGFCTPGIVMTLTALLSDVPHPAAEDIRRALAGNICRCTGYSQIIEAIITLTQTPPAPAHSSEQVAP